MKNQWIFSGDKRGADWGYSTKDIRKGQELSHISQDMIHIIIILIIITIIIIIIVIICIYIIIIYNITYIILYI